MTLSTRIKSILKKSCSMKKYYHKIKSRFISVLYTISPVLLARYLFRIKRGRSLNLKNPQTFDEKLLWLNLYWRHPLKTQCADKYMMRAYVKNHGLGHMLPELLGVYEKSKDIDFNALPERFVLKCTHGNGFNIICLNKSKLDLEETRHKLDAWMKIDSSKRAGELHYALIKPRIICEVYLDDSTGGLPVDYKIQCFDGKAYCTLVCCERHIDEHDVKLAFYDREWKKKLPYVKSGILAKKDIPMPGTYPEMVDAAEKLSKPFPHVRVDFYNINGKAVIGEMTFTQAGCIFTVLTDVAEEELGKLIKLPEKFFV